jgi:hypothetical protein
VWQDFAFACIDYPDDDPRLRTEVEHEAAHQVRQLRNHACLALWCGNNEVQLIHVMGYADLRPGGWGSAFFDEVLPEAVATHDGSVPYWPGRPYGEPADGEERVRATGFNYFVRIRTPAPQVRFSDNYLDLRDDDTAEIAVRGLTEHIGDDQLRAISGLTR